MSIFASAEMQGSDADGRHFSGSEDRAFSARWPQFPYRSISGQRRATLTRWTALFPNDAQGHLDLADNAGQGRCSKTALISLIGRSSGYPVPGRNARALRRFDRNGSATRHRLALYESMVAEGKTVLHQTRDEILYAIRSPPRGWSRPAPGPVRVLAANGARSGEFPVPIQPGSPAPDRAWSKLGNACTPRSIFSSALSGAGDINGPALTI